MLNHKQTSKGADWFALVLGWLSIALGLAGFMASRKTAKAIGVKNRPMLFKLIGLREIASGLGIFLVATPSKVLIGKIVGGCPTECPVSIWKPGASCVSSSFCLAPVDLVSY